MYFARPATGLAAASCDARSCDAPMAIAKSMSFVYKHAVWSDVAVDEAERRRIQVGEAVDVLESSEDIENDSPMCVQRQCETPRASTLNDSVQRLPVEELHRDEDARPLAPHFYGLHDVLMVESRREPRFLDKSSHDGFIPNEVLPQLLDGEQFAEPVAPSQLPESHRCHTAARQLGHEKVPSEARDRSICVFGRGSVAGNRQIEGGRSTERAV
jgi:hypothetical protein